MFLWVLILTKWMDVALHLLKEGMEHILITETLSPHHFLIYLLNTTWGGYGIQQNMAYHLTPDLHSCVQWSCKWKINPHVLKIKAIGKNNGELIAGEISEEENLILLLMEEHLLFINFSSKTYATLQLNQLTQSLLIILGHECPAAMAEKTQDSCWDTKKGILVARQVLLSQSLELGSMDRSVQPVLLCSMGPCLMLDDLTVPTFSGTAG